MKKVLFAFTVFMLFSCEKMTEPETMDLSLLKQFDWQAIKQTEKDFIMSDKSQKILYSDTSRYSFTDNKFIYNTQHTVVKSILGGEPRYVLNQQTSTIEGYCEINPLESSINLTYISIVGANPAWDVPGVETTIHTKYKIISLNRDTLKIKSVPTGESPFPPLEIIQTYSSVKK